MSDTEQDGVPISPQAPNEAPTIETTPAEMPASLPDNVETASVSLDSEAIAQPAPIAPPDSPAPAEIPTAEHSNILEADRVDIGTYGRNVGMSVEADSSPPPASSPISAENPSPSLPTPAESPAPALAPLSSAILSLRGKALEAIQFRRRARLEKIIVLAEKKRSIGNDDVEKLLRVSNATASRYLSSLVRDGKLKRMGHSQATKYSLPVASNGAV